MSAVLRTTLSTAVGLPLVDDSNPRLAASSGGGGGIRTPGTVRYSGFQDHRLKPLGHSSGASV